MKIDLLPKSFSKAFHAKHISLRCPSLTKTDAKDAKMLASYAQMLALCSRENLLTIIYDSQKVSIEQRIAHFDRLIAELEYAIEQATVTFNDVVKKFKDIKGIRLITSATFTNKLPRWCSPSERK